MKRLLFIALFFSFLISCTKNKNDSQSKKYEYSLVEAESGIAFEKFKDSIKDDNKYNINNTILVPGRSFTYDFKHLTKDGETKYFRKFKKEDDYKWEFVAGDHPKAIRQLKVGVLSGNPMAQWYPNYNQTSLSYTLQHDKRFSMSGGVENEANLWIHPPRDLYFSILELNPFPYIKAPYKVGTEWTWNLLIGSQWGDPRWKEWKGNIKNNYTYKIISKETLDSKIGPLECLVVEGLAESNLGQTKLMSYFNEKYGFVKLEFTNIDGSNTFLEIYSVEGYDQ